ncbi:LysR substrate-binding domain-containing protein [Yoonia sediminilitoris]|uniref:LysR substrate-binding domain-containing protein n=1 Tax=Yoonia sediminilitoris TaxID=1286148 RepID=UPI001FEB41E5|nr:LysR substrate-binding domain-containing protein [Yoonia sediminilitoris]
MGDYPGHHVRKIFDEQVSPVCSPKLLEGSIPLVKLEDLKSHRLLHVDWGSLTNQSPDWQMWALAAGLEDVSFSRGPRFTIENMAIEAAINADGVALVSHAAVVEDLKAGRLVRPFNLTVRSDLAYWLVCPQEHLLKANVSTFCDWLLAKVGEQ